MNLLPRILGLSLFVVLAVLTALLAAPLLTPPAAVPVATVSAGAPAASPPRAARFVTLPARLVFPLALTSLALAVALLASLSLRSTRTGEAAPALEAARADIGALSSLAKSSVAQGQALTQERNIRQQAEKDSLLHQQLLTQSIDEKVRLGRDLHDGIIQALYAAGLTVESARALVTQDPAEADRRLASCVQSLNTTIREVRNYISGLTSEHLRNAGFLQAVKNLTTEISAGREVSFDLKMENETAALLTPDQTIEALQVIREAISNALRHGGATVITVALLRDDRQVCLLVRDNGRGFDPSGPSGPGRGLGNMKARADCIGAKVQIVSTPDAGTRVLLTLPLPV